VEKDTEWVPVDTEDFFLESTRQPAEEAAPTPRNPTPPGLPNIEIEISQLYPEEMMTEPEEEVSRQNFAHSIGHINGWTSAATRQIIQLLHTALLAICCTLYHVIHRNFEL
jgi:hypothetical protein